MENVLSLITQLDLGETEADDSSSVPSASSNEAPNQGLQDSEKADGSLTCNTQLDMGGTEANDSNSVLSASGSESAKQHLEDTEKADRALTGNTQLDMGGTEADDSNSMPSASSNEGPNQYLEDSGKAGRARTGNAQLDMGGTDANDSNSVLSASGSETVNQDLEVSRKKYRYKTKEKFNLCFRTSWDNYWNKVLGLIRIGKKPTFRFQDMYKELHRSLSKIMKQENYAHTGDQQEEVAEGDRTLSTSSHVDLEDIEKKGLCEIKGNFRKQSSRCCKYYWKKLSQLLENNPSLKCYLFSAEHEITEKLFTMKSPQISYEQHPARILSISCWFLVNPTYPVQPEEEVILVIYQSKYQPCNPVNIMEQKTDAGVKAESVLLERLRILKEENNFQFEGEIELVCNWSSRTRSIKLAKDIKKMHIRIKKIIIKTRRKPSTATSLVPYLEVHHFKDADWKELHKYLANEGKSYIGVGGPSESQISEVLNSSVVHRRVLPLSVWFLFNEQWRIGYVEHLTCILCCVKFKSAKPFCLFETNESGVHAEPLILMRLEEMQIEAKKRNDTIRCIRIYSTYSPCVDCTSRYSSFLEEMAELEELHLIVSCVYNAKLDEVNSALKEFWDKWQHKIKLEAFNDKYWDALKKHLSEEGAKYLEDRSARFKTRPPDFAKWLVFPRVKN